YVLPVPWNCCPADDHSFFGPADPHAALAILTERHTAQELVASGIVWADAEGTLALHPLLAVADVGVVVLIDSLTGSFRNLMTQPGGLLCTHAPLFEALGDKHTFAALDGAEDQNMLLTDTFADTVLLRSLSMAAAPRISRAPNLSPSRRFADSDLVLRN